MPERAIWTPSREFLAVLQDMAADWKRKERNPRNRTADQTFAEEHQAPETYIGQAVGSIPGLTDSGTGTGSAAGYPGVGLCDVYQTLDLGSTPRLANIGRQITVYNLGDEITAGEWVALTRDKFGRWLVVASGGASSSSVICDTCSPVSCIPIMQEFFSDYRILADGAPITITSLPAGTVVHRVYYHISDTPFDAGCTLTLGTITTPDLWCDGVADVAGHQELTSCPTPAESLMDRTGTTDLVAVITGASTQGMVTIGVQASVPVSCTTVAGWDCTDISFEALPATLTMTLSSSHVDLACADGQTITLELAGAAYWAGEEAICGTTVRVELNMGGDPPTLNFIYDTSQEASCAYITEVPLSSLDCITKTLSGTGADILFTDTAICSGAGGSPWTADPDASIQWVINWV